MSRAREFADLAGSADAGGITGSNIITNGAMRIAQRGTSTTGLQNTGGVFTIDRFSHRRGGSWSNAQFKHEQVDATVTGEPSLNKALKVTCTTAEGSVPASGEAVAIGCSYLEKGDTHRLGVGTSAALKSTFSFYARASIATTYGFEIHAYQHSTAQAIRIPFTISSANTWERISVSIPADTAALDSDADNTSGWLMHIVLDGEASSDTASAWADIGSSGVRLPNGVSTTAFSNTLNATFELTGVQLEAGEVATPFQHEDTETTLAKCQRYYFRIDEGVTYQRFALGSCANSNNAQTTITLPVTMRTTPSVDTTGTAGDYAFFEAGTVHTLTSLPAINAFGSNAQSVNVTCTSTGNFAAGNAGEFLSNNDASVFFALSAEL
tara:strand:+ start:222 stop:1364 length:1143 start_codon:yes stop_codon:yes gene_type:complete